MIQTKIGKRRAVRGLGVLLLATIGSVIAAAPAHATAFGSVGGHITTADGTPVPGIQVLLFEGNTSSQPAATATTDASGGYLFTGVPVTSAYDEIGFIYFNQEEIFYPGPPAPITLGFGVSAGVETVIDQVATTAQATPPPPQKYGSAQVTVTDGAGNPVVGDPVDVSNGSNNYEVVTDSLGQATFPSVVVGMYAVSAAAPDAQLVPVTTSVAVAEGQNAVLTLVLYQQVTFKVTILDAVTAAPVPNACVGAVGPNAHNVVNLQKCAGADGVLTITGLSPAKYRLFVSPQDGTHGAQWVGATGGTGDLDAAQVFSPKAGKTVLVTVRLDGAGSISGNITDKKTHAGVSYLCPTVVPRGAFGSNPLFAECAAFGGHYQIDGLGPYQWKVEFPDTNGVYAWQWSGGVGSRGQATAVAVTVGGNTPLDIALPRAGSISGTVTPPPFQHGAYAVTAYDTWTGDFAAKGATSSALDGTYQITGLGYVAAQVVFNEGGYHDYLFASVIQTQANVAVTGINFSIPG